MKKRLEISGALTKLFIFNGNKLSPDVFKNALTSPVASNPLNALIFLCVFAAYTASRSRAEDNVFNGLCAPPLPTVALIERSNGKDFFARTVGMVSSSGIGMSIRSALFCGVVTML